MTALNIRLRLLCGAATLAALAAPAAAQETIETSSYTIQAMTQSFDGAREHAQAQALAYARMRRGSESWIELDFGDGATVIEDADGTAAGRFVNTSGVEAGLRYDYATRQLSSGGTMVERFHNTFVRRQLGRGPAPGADARWQVSLLPVEAGVVASAAAPISIELSRQYLTHEGREYVLLHYRIPAFAYDAMGAAVVQWGEGAALTDPGFGTMYWNAALHRAVAERPGEAARPYRETKTLLALDEAGRPLFDPRSIPEVAALVERLNGHEASEVLGFVEGALPDHTPLILARNLDVLALSIAEDSPNQLGEVTSQLANGTNGQISTTPASIGSGAAQAISTMGADAYANPQPGGGGAAPTLQTLPHEPAHTLQSGGSGGSGSGGAASPTRPAGPAQPVQVQPASFGGGGAGGSGGAGGGGGASGGGGSSGSGGYFTEEQTSAAATQMGILDKGVATLNALGADRETILIFEGIERYRAEGQMLAYQLKAAMERQDRYLQIIEDIARDGKGTLDPDQWHLYQVNADNIRRLEGQVEAYGQRGAQITARLDDVPASKLGQMMEAFKSTKGAAAMSVFSHLMNAQATAGAGVNAIRAATHDMGRGTLPLSRPYDASAPMVLGLDLLGMFANLASGDVAAAISDATALASTSVSDLFVSLKGLRDTNRIQREASEEGTRLARAQREQYERRQREADARYQAEIAELDAEIARLDTLPDARELARQRLAEYRARQQLARQAEEEAYREAVVEVQQPVWTSEPTAEEWDQFRRDINAAMQPDYPTVSAAERARISAEAAARREAERQSELARQAFEAAVFAAEAARTAAEREQQLREARRIADEAMARREAERRRRENWLAEARNRGLEVSELVVSEFDITPVEFNPPTWTPPQWFPPEWVPPEFDPPEISEIGWTNFDDDDYPGGGNNLAFMYENMSGTVETDLSRWAEWLATQDVRRLERLALQAGYPNLASALADAENIIRQSQDSGYRNWAMQPPSCGGYVGCGPSYLERWAMKTSIVALGDILADSREIFSTGGFSDIGISGANLAYLLRDHGAQDGDIVQITIQQFGRPIYQGRLSLTNAGDNFTLPLRSGVASLTIYAENEGQFSPNTAQINVQNVVDGEATQTYNLLTGQSATLRIATNAQAGGN